MDDEKLKKQIGANIASYRKRHSLTQAGLAEKLNYSDKAVSKWERGESVPDVPTLVQLADLFDITELAHHGPEDVFISGVTIVGALVIMFSIQWQLAVIVALVILSFF